MHRNITQSETKITKMCFEKIFINVLKSTSSARKYKSI